MLQFKAPEDQAAWHVINANIFQTARDEDDPRDGDAERLPWPTPLGAQLHNPRIILD
jgi:hypothetical protein